MGSDDDKYFYPHFCDGCKDYNHFDPCTHCSRNLKTRLDEIGYKLGAVEKKQYSPSVNLETIKTELANIVNIDTFKNEVLGNLESLKNEIAKNLEKPVYTSFTTGPVLASPCTGNVKISVLNNTDASQIATVNLYDITTIPKSLVHPSPITLTIQAQTSEVTTFTAVPSRYEVQFMNLIPGLYAFAAGTVGTSDVLEPSCTFYHKDLVRLIDYSISTKEREE